MADSVLIQSIHEDVKEIKVLLTGNGTPERGLIVRTDRLEQSHKNMSKAFWMILGAVLAPGGAAILYLFSY